MTDARPETGYQTPGSAIRLHHQLDAIWGSGRGWQRFSAVNHNVVGMRFMVTALVFFAIGGVLAMLIRAQLASTNSAFLDAAQYAQVFTMHGVIMMFLFAIPFFEGLAIYLLPKMLGARDLAFPRMSAYGYWCYLFGGSFLVAALIFGIAPDGGWFMYTPLSSRPYSPGINADVWLLGITFVEISALSAAIEIMVTILKVRSPGMSLTRMPIFAWYMLVAAAMMLIGFPPLILGSILLEVQRAFDWAFFDPARGGDPILWQHLFWLFGHPEVYIIFLPAAGALSTIIPVLSRTRLEGYGLIVAAIVAMAFLSFGLWVHHMYTVGIPHVALSFFSAASALVAIPTGIQIFAWLATMAHGKSHYSIPMLHVFGFFFVFVAGGLTGVMLAMVPFDWQAHDTLFRRGTSALRAGRRLRLSDDGSGLLLAAAYHRTPTRAASVEACLLAYFHRLQRHLLHHAPDGPSRHAATGVRISAGDRLGGVELHLLRRRLRHDHRLRACGARPDHAHSSRPTISA